MSRTGRRRGTQPHQVNGPAAEAAQILRLAVSCTGARSLRETR